MTVTVIEKLEQTVRAHGSRPAMRAKRAGSWETTSWSDYRDQAFRAARGMMRLGLEPGRGVVILGSNRPEWFLADIGAIAAGGLPAGIYTTSTTDQACYVAEHCDAQIGVVENEGHLDTLLAGRGGLPRLQAFVLMSGSSERDDVYSWNELLQLGGEVPETEVRSRIESQGLDDPCTLIYTSGTTGPPKAVMLSHRNIVWVTERLLEAYDFDHHDSVLSYLPLSHIAEQVVSLHAPLAGGGCTWFAESLDKLGQNLQEVRPQFFFGVPRVWEKIQARIEAVGARNRGLKRVIARWARRQGLAGGYADQTGSRRPLLYPLAERLVFSKVRARLGLDRARICATSAAPISTHTLEFFLSLGIPILEVYGMSECTGPGTFSLPHRYRTGKAGFAIPGAEVRTADDGEILMRGPHVFLGYLKDPAATEAALDDQGWLHSGDIGDLDPEGFLTVTDRKKELIITSGGKNVAPQPIEARLREIPGVAHAAVVGDRRNYLVALLALDPDAFPHAAVAAGSPATDAASAARCPGFRDWIDQRVEEINRSLARFETVKRFSLLPEPFSIDHGELTPTMKLKRRIIESRHAAAIDDLYS